MKPALQLPGCAPDVFFVANAHLNRLKKTYLEDPADLVVEIISAAQTASTAPLPLMPRAAVYPKSLESSVKSRLYKSCPLGRGHFAEDALLFVMPKTLLAPLFLLDLAATLYLWGVIWTVQLVHYPLFARVGPAQWADYHSAHTRLMTYVVLPAMVTELGASGLLALARPVWLSPSLLWAGFACAVLTWAVTFFVSVPLHDTLSRGFDPSAITRLVATNWLRTFFWTAHALILLTQISRLLPRV